MLRGGYLYVAVQPAKGTVESLTPQVGPAAGGQSVTITGTGLSGVTSVKFGDTMARQIVVANDTTITATTPAHAPGPVDVMVGDSPNLATLRNGYTYTT